jgi:methyl-accepting chemotaxis protein
MSVFFRLTISQRLLVLLGLVLIGCLLLLLSGLVSLRAQLMADRVDKTRSLVEVAHSLVVAQYARQAAGELGEDEAHAAALSALRELRYDDGNYVWVNDMAPTMLMHPIKPALDGKPLASIRDPNGVPLFTQMVDVVRADGAGTVNYHWPKPGSEAPVAKVSYVKGFAPWGWIVGTGVYVDDVDALFADIALDEMLQTGLVLALLVAVAYAIGRSVIVPIKTVTRAMMDIVEGEGDLTRRLVVDGRNEVAALADYFNRYTARIEDSVCAVRDTAAELATASAALSQAASDNSATIDRQSGETQQVATAITEMAATVTEIAASAEGAAKATGDADSHARVGRERVERVAGEIASLAQGIQDTAGAVTALNAKSEAIGGVLDVIRGVAEQTNLLALNAAIEAARAGEQGRGFAVVADEVRTLASRTQQSTHEIQDMIAQLQSGSALAVSAIEGSRAAIDAIIDRTTDARQSLDKIVAAVDTINDKAAQVASAAEQQAVATQQIDRSIVAISGMAGDSADSARQTSIAATEVARLGEGLSELVGSFRMRDQTG